MTELTTAQFTARMQKLDQQLAACLDLFFEDTGVAVSSVLIDYAEEGYGITLGLAFPEE